MSKKKPSTQIALSSPVTTTDPREIVANTANSKYTIENKDDKKLIEKLHTPEGKISRVIYAPNNNEVKTISTKKQK